MDGYLTSISGPSKIGKTVLCEKVIGFEHLVEVLRLYGLILEAIAVDPPVVSVSFDGLMSRILSLISGDEKPTAKSLKDDLKNLQEVLSDKGRFIT